MEKTVFHGLVSFASASAAACSSATFFVSASAFEAFRSAWNLASPDSASCFISLSFSEAALLRSWRSFAVRSSHSATAQRHGAL